MIIQEKYRPYLAGAAVLVFLYLTLFTVRETEFVLITQFGRPLYSVNEAGMHVK